MERIKRLLAEAGIAEYIAVQTEERTAELFFVRQQLDTRRIKDVSRVSVSVYRESGEGEERQKGQSDAMLLPAMSDEACVKALRDAYYAAQFAMNPWYAAPDPIRAPQVKKTGEIMERSCEELAGLTAKALFDADDAEGAFVNSAEVFVSQRTVRVISSEGADVSWTEGKAEGEYVVQALEPEDVEMHRQFAFDELDCETLSDDVREALRFVRDRARAQSVLKSGVYDLILTRENAATVLRYYCQRSSARMCYPGYSTWKPGDDVQGESSGERLELTLRANTPYSWEGIPMTDKKLLTDGKLQIIHGENRLCRYLGIPATGDYRRFSCENEGSLSFAEMKARPCLWAVTFSDFQMDSFSGHFGGEIRLAYLIEDGVLTPVTGGSVNGSLMEAQSGFAFSKERFTGMDYRGPYALMLKNVKVAGTQEAE